MTDQEQAQVSFPEHPCRMPHTERVAREGVLFRNCNTIAAHCCPSRASFMTGLYPSRHGVYNNVNTHTAIHRGLNDGVVTFSELLKESGYRMVYSGKWHVSNRENPRDRGWEERAVGGPGNSEHGRPPLSRWEEAAQEPEQRRNRGQVLRPGWGNYQVYGTQPDTNGYRDSRDYEFVSLGIEALGDLTSGNDPWCLFIGPNGPHDPFIIPEPYASMYDPGDIELPPSYQDRMEDKPRIYQRMRQQYWDQLSETEVRESIAFYWGYCTMMDDMFGEIMKALDATGEADRTVVVRMSDHGDYCGAHGLYCKGVPPFREAYNIPLVIRWPEGISQPGRETDALVNLLDFAPTFLELGGVTDIPELIAGRSLTPFFGTSEPEDWRDAHCTQFNGVELYYTQRVVQTHTCKYVYNGFDFDEMYDLLRDPHEMTNVSERSEYQGLKKDLVKRMWQTALAEEDIITNPYATVAMAPWGPGIAME
ncbi:uncharacterized protein METZ01_LOCUS158786 [marine metagenome]|uniref:Sulfatase N-terminal domain-containing protein n=1 Tax=marine metagenome TaxID=408172 RepID=A0A382AXY4_9ZZZZ